MDFTLAFEFGAFVHLRVSLGMQIQPSPVHNSIATYFLKKPRATKKRKIVILCFVEVRIWSHYSD